MGICLDLVQASSVKVNHQSCSPESGKLQTKEQKRGWEVHEVYGLQAKRKEAGERKREGGGGRENDEREMR